MMLGHKLKEQIKILFKRNSAKRELPSDSSQVIICPVLSADAASERQGSLSRDRTRSSGSTIK